MSIRWGKGETRAMAEVLDAEHETLEDASLAALKVAEDLFRQRCQLTVVGQLWKEGAVEVPPSDERAIKVCLGFFSTRGDADAAAKSLVYSAQSGDTFRVWTLPVLHQSAAEIHKGIKERVAKEEAKASEARRVKFRESIEKYAAAREAATQAALEETA